ncbi:MAG: hypothetical protein AAF827_23750, partial [Cyanobacteria bacterium P01_D01_bin.6]
HHNGLLARAKISWAIASYSKPYSAYATLNRCSAHSVGDLFLHCEFCRWHAAIGGRSQSTGKAKKYPEQRLNLCKGIIKLLHERSVSRAVALRFST